MQVQVKHKCLTWLGTKKFLANKNILKDVSLTMIPDINNQKQKQASKQQNKQANKLYHKYNL